MLKFFRNTAAACLLGAIAGFAIVACTSLEKPQGTIEQAMYAEAGAQGAIKTLMDLTCKQYSVAGVCADATRPLHPAQSELYLEAIAKSRRALRVVSTMPSTGVANCLGAMTSQVECLRVAQSLLAEVQRVLVEMQKRGGAT